VAALSAQRQQIDERAAPDLRAGMPALQSLAFEANEGQVDASVKFLARSGGHQLQLNARSIIQLGSNCRSAQTSRPGTKADLAPNPIRR